jgi:large repetitive protein
MGGGHMKRQRSQTEPRSARPRSLRTVGVLAACLATLALASTAFVTSAAADPPSSGPQIRICHASDSDTNPYTNPTVDQSAIINNGVLDPNGHGTHIGPVWNPTLKDNHIKWGDIIPSFGDYAGLNWDAAGQAIWNNGCSVDGSLTVTKVVDGEASGQPFAVTVNCGGGDFQLTFDSTGKETSNVLPITGLAPGTQCTVNETDDGGASSTSYSPSATVSIGTATTSTVTVTNTFDEAPPVDPGSLSVTKSVSGEAGDTSFKVHVDCTGDSFDQDLTFNGAGTQTISDIPAGTLCSVTETDDGGATSTTYDPHGATTADPPTGLAIISGETRTVTVTNTFVTEEEGKVTLCHATNSNTNPYVEVTVDQSAVYNNGVVPNGHGTHTGPIWDPTLKAQHKDWGDIIPAFGNYPGLNVPGGQTILDNHCKLASGSLTVTKSVIGDAGTATFTVEVDCGDGPQVFVFDATGTLTSGSLPITGLPTGVECTVTETDAGGASTTTYVPNGGTPSDAPTVSISGQPQTVAITNSFLGDLTVTKSVVGDAGGESFTVVVDCGTAGFPENFVFDSNGVLTSGSLPITGVHAGTECSVTETDAGGASSTTYRVNAGLASDSAPTVTVVGDATTTVTITNTFTEGPPVVLPTVPPAQVLPAVVARPGAVQVEGTSAVQVEGALAFTGSSLVQPLAVTGTVLILLGMMVLVVRKRRYGGATH